MNKKIKISIAMIATFLLAILAINLALATSLGVNTAAEIPASTTNVSTPPTIDISISAELVEDEEKLKELVPTTLEEAEASIVPIQTRYLMWTNDGTHIMWGSFGNGRFAGTDNLGKRCWGIYGRGIFAGFYDGQFFWGKYDRSTWKAQYLFGMENSYGKYVTFPQIITSSTDAANIAP